MKKILAILVMIMMCVGMNAQDITYSKGLLEAARKGDAKSMNDVGECYYYGYGISRDFFQAVYWYNKGAENGNADAMGNMGWCYEAGKGVSKNYYQAVYWYKKGAENGNVWSMCKLGYCYKTGRGVSKNLPQAVYWYRKGAENGNAGAMFNLGYCYHYGQGVSQDYSQAVHWYKKAAENGHDKAMTNLGFCHEKGHGVSRNYPQAVYWYKKAAENGNTTAMKNLAIKYKNGECGMPVSAYKSQILYAAHDKAAAGDKKGAMELLYQVFPDMAKPKIDPSNPPIIQIVPGSISFADASGNNAIDANEICSVRFKVKNMGRGAGYECVAKVKSSVYGINAGEKKIDEIKAGEIIDIDIPVTSNINTKDGTTDLAVSVYEPNGLGCDPTLLNVNTKAFVPPLLKIVDYAATSEAGGKLRKMQPFTLKMILQNTQYGKAEDVNVSIDIPDDVLLVDGDSSKSYALIDGGDRKNISIGLMAKNVYKASSIPVKVTISEKYGKYAESRTIDLAMNQQMSAHRIVIDENGTSPQGNIKIAQIEGKVKLSDVDQNIPHTKMEGGNTFAVIIANENYLQESKVPFALNDGKMFGVYCEEVLGLPNENIRVLNDATLNQIRGGVNWLKKVADAYKGNANLIFYYAGHGVPDESTKDAYMLPVDGYGNDLITAYKMEDLYSMLSSCPSKQTLVFLDACFSGRQRCGEDMATARAVGTSVRKTAPKGNMVVFSAAQGDETAYPYMEKQHGMFTYFLLKKLQQSKGKVTLGELGSYIKDNVMRKSVVTNTRSQTPTVQPSSSMQKNWKDIRL